MKVYTRKVAPAQKRFWNKVLKKSSSECWLWTGCTEKKGHGRFRDENNKLEMAHRYSYRLHKGHIPSGMCICHSCDNPSCVNPYHLWVGTKGDNNKDRASKGRNVNNRGSKHGQSRLTEEYVGRIRKGFLAGETQTDLAKKYGVSITAISKVCNRKTWKHI